MKIEVTNRSLPFHALFWIEANGAMTSIADWFTDQDEVEEITEFDPDFEAELANDNYEKNYE